MLLLILLLPNKASLEGLFWYATSISRCLATLVFGSFLIINISSLVTAPLAVYLAIMPAPIVLKTLGDLLEWFLNSIIVLLSFFTISNNNIHYH